jgi:glycosyltransferase involved in cell wall biosynthesis
MNTEKKIVYVGHSYHNKTKSTDFLIDYLKQFFDVEVILDESWIGKPFSNLSFVNENYLAVIFFQVLPPPNIFEKIKNTNIIYFPMYDQSGDCSAEFWNNYPNLKIINFSKTLHEKMKEWGFDSIYVQYFPEVREFMPGNKREVFFWQRHTGMNINQIANLFGEDSLKIHIHKAVDPSQEFVQPSPKIEKKYKITYSDWFDTREEMLDLIRKKGIYVAPRSLEGIGMSFLEAMAMGKAVIAVDNPTMNEYITHGENGYLFDMFHPQKIDLSNLEKVQKNAYEFMCRGRERWEKERRSIITFIEKNSVAFKKNDLPMVNIITVTYNAKNDLEKTIKSVADQDYPKINYIIIDGGSNDGTAEMAKKYKGKISVFISEKDNGIYDGMNKGIAKAKEGYLNFLNAGDIFVSENAISKVFRNIGDRYDMVYGKIIVGEITRDKIENPQGTMNFTEKNILNHNTAVLCHQAMFLKKEKAPLYDPSFKIKGDLDWYFEILKKNPHLTFWRSDVTITNYKGGGISEKKYFLDIFELSKLIIKRFGLNAFFRYRYHSYAVKRICRQNKWLMRFFYFFRGARNAVLSKMKKKIKLINPLYRKIDNEILPELESMLFILNTLNVESNSLHSTYRGIELALDYTACNLGQMEKEIERLTRGQFYQADEISLKEKGFSHLNEEEVIEKYLSRMPVRYKYCVDIAASDGITMSNTLFLFKGGWRGLAVECDSENFAKLSFLYKDFENVDLIKTKVTPQNAVSLLKSASCPTNFAFLNFDIDSYDFFILEKILENFRPLLICAEINESIPPPIKFTVKYDPDHSWNTDHFFGQSISKCSELCDKYKYDIVELHYNNIFLIPRESSVFESLSPERAYNEGYRNKKDRKEKFPWNEPMEGLLTMAKEEGVEFIKRKFDERYKGKYILQ